MGEVVIIVILNTLILSNVPRTNLVNAIRPAGYHIRRSGWVRSVTLQLCKQDQHSSQSREPDPQQARSSNTHGSTSRVKPRIYQENQGKGKTFLGFVKNSRGLGENKMVLYRGG